MGTAGIFPPSSYGAYMKRFFLSIALAATLAGCAGQTYQDTVNTAQITNTALLEMVDRAVINKQVSRADAINLVKQIDTAQQGIDLANSSSDISTDRLKASQQILAAVRDYLIKRGVK